MNDSRVRAPFSDRLTSRKGAWVTLGAVLLGFTLLFGLFGQASVPTGTDAAPLDSESARASELLQKFPDANSQSVLVVGAREDAQKLTDADTKVLTDLVPVLDEQLASTASGPLLSDDGAAAVIIAPIEVGESNAETAETVKALRAEIEAQGITSLDLYVTGGPAFGADVTSAFDGADFTLLTVTIGIVALLLIITYRSPILWLIPLLVVALADRLASAVTAAVGTGLDLQFDAGIISVLVFGAGTNYALLLISRYREELLETVDHREALSRAWRKTVPAIVASNVTVVLALLTLVLAVIPGTHGLGISSAVGLIIALLAVLFALPPLLAIFGRKIFWPFIPKPDIAATQGTVKPGTAKQGSAWQAIATRVMRRPAVSLVAGLALLAVMSTGLIGTTVGLDQAEKFRVQSESAAGLEVLAEHFPAGEAQPILVVAKTAEVDPLLDKVNDLEGVVRAHVVEETTDGELTKIMVTGEYAPGTDGNLALVEEIRSTADDMPAAEALVGGEGSTDLDARAGNQQDLLRIAPLVLAVSFVVLLLLLKSVVAPVLLLLVNIASALAAIGLGSWLSRVLFDQPALDLQVPLLAFLFLVALGIDYTIFLVHRAKIETAQFGTREGMVRAVARTGSVITSAGIVLAAVFAALGVLPLVTLGQLGLIVGIGVVVDTLVVRTVIVPSIFGLLGDRMWWPGKGPEPRSTHTSAQPRIDERELEKQL